jgi:aryl-alcohol dehydrogenase-like predicted oxidoreductase
LLVRDLEKERLPAMRHYGLGLLPYFPLASGMLTGKYRKGKPLPAGSRLAGAKWAADRYLNDANWDRVEKLAAFCAERGRSMLELAFSWLAARPCVASVIAGATKPEQVEQNMAATTWAMTPEELAEVDKITGPATS